MLRRLLRNRMVLPAVVVAGVGVAGALSFGVGAGAQGTPGSSTAPAVRRAGAVTAARTTALATKRETRARDACKSPSAPAEPANSGTPRSSVRRCRDGQVVAYGNSAILYQLPSQSPGQAPTPQYLAAGESLFEQNCSSCHGPAGAGSAAAPNLVGLGPATVMFWVTTGRMPATTPLTVQAPVKPPRLTDAQAAEIAAWINSLDPAAPYVPKVNLKGANLAEGASLFALNCAACHTITGAGDALAYGTYAPPLHKVTPTQIASAIRTGPTNMPLFTGNLSDNQVRDIVAYVSEKIQHPTNNGGFGLGGVGPVAEGFVALLVGVGLLVLICFWIGDRA